MCVSAHVSDSFNHQQIPNKEDGVSGKSSTLCINEDTQKCVCEMPAQLNRDQQRATQPLHKQRHVIPELRNHI